MICSVKLFFAQGLKVPNVQHGVLLILLALVLLIGHVMMNLGFKFFKASEGSLILMSEVVFTQQITTRPFS